MLASNNANRHLRAEANFLTARALWAKGDRDKAVQMAAESRAGLADADPSFGYRLKQINDWLAGNG